MARSAAHVQGHSCLGATTREAARVRDGISAVQRLQRFDPGRFRSRCTRQPAGLGGLRQSDAGTIAGISYFALGMSLLVPLYGFVGWILWRGRTPTRLVFAAFFTIFGFFMVLMMNALAWIASFAVFQGGKALGLG